MEEFLPGLLKMMEQRLGRNITTVFLWIVVLGISAWMLRLLWDNVIWPLTLIARNIFENLPFASADVSTVVVSLALPISMVTLVILVVMVLYNYIVLGTKNRRIDERYNKAKDLLTNSEQAVTKALKAQDKTQEALIEANEALIEAEQLRSEAQVIYTKSLSNQQPIVDTEDSQSE